MADFDLERYERARASAPAGRSARPASTATPAASGRKIVWKGSSGSDAGGGGGPSLFQQIPGAIFNASKGLVTGMIPAITDSVVGTPLATVANIAGLSADDVRGSKGILGSLQRAAINENFMEAAEQGKGLAGMFDAAAPILSGPAKSFAQTGREAGDLVGAALTDKGFDETGLGRASKEGRTVDWLLENVGNTLFAGRLASGAAASAATRAGASAPRLQKFAEVARKADDALDKTLLAPIAVPLKGVGAGVRAAARSDAGQNVAKSGLGQEARKRLLTPATRDARDTMAKFDQINAIRREDEAISPAKRVQRILSGVENGAKRRDRRAPEVVQAAEGAMFLGLLDTAPVLGPLRSLRDANPAAFVATVERAAEQSGNASITPDAVGMFLDKIDGNLDETLAADIDRAAAEWTQRANEGGLTRDIDGTEVITGATPNFIAGTGRLTDTPDGPGQRAESLTARERIFEGDPEDLTTAPARFREPVAIGRQIQSAIDDLDPTEFPLPAGLADSIKGEILSTVDRGLAELNPAFVRGGTAPSSTAGPTTPKAGPKASKISSQYVKGGGNAPLQVDAQAALAANDIRRQTTNQMLGEIQEKLGVRASQVPEAQGLSGAALLDAVSTARGERYVAWDPSKVFERSSDPTRTRDSIRTKVDDASPESVLVPEWLADAMDYTFKEDSKLAQLVIDKPMRVFKAAVLALAPRWQVGNLISGAIMLHGGKVSPVDIAKYHGRARQAMRDYAAGRRSEVPREVLGAGHSASERRLLDGFANSLDNADFDEMATRQSANPASRAVGGLVRKGYDANTFVDDMYRSIAYLKKVEEGAPPRQAVSEALAIMGDYDKMTPFERRFVRRAFPFYPWVKHISGLTAKLATDDPARITWNLHLPTLFTPEDAQFEGPEWMRGMAKVGDDQFMSMSWLFPFGTVAEIPTNPVEFVAGQMNPLLQTAIAAGTGVDPSFGRFELLSQPGGEFGKNAGPPILKNPLSLPYLVGSNLPQLSGLYDELQRRRSGGEGQRLFGTGERMGRADPNKDLEDNLARILGVPIPKTYNAG